MKCIKVLLLLFCLIPAQLLTKSAGIFPYIVKDGKVQFLLGKEKNGTWADFGGSADPNEKPKDTAAREFSEETRHVYGKFALRLDLKQNANLKKIEQASINYIKPRITHEIVHPKRYYVLFLAHVDYIPQETFTNAFKTPQYDKVDYRWVDAQELLHAMRGADRDNAFFDDMKIRRQLVDTLQDQPMQDALQNIMKGQLTKAPAERTIKEQPKQPIQSQQEAFITVQGHQQKVESVSVLPFALHQGKILFLLGSEVRGINNRLMYYDFATQVDDSAFVKGKFDPLIPAGYAFQATSRFLFGKDTAGYIRMAIRKAGKRAFYDAHLKTLVCLGEIEYKPIDSESHPCRWVDAEDFLKWIRRNNFNIDNFDVPFMYNTVPIYQPFAAVLKKVVGQVEAEIYAVKNKHLAQAQQLPAGEETLLKENLFKLNTVLNQLQGALASIA